MIISFDIDGCVTHHPQLFKAMGDGIRAAGGELHFITARPASMRLVTIKHLVLYGFAFVEHGHEDYLHMYPDDYQFPWANGSEEARIRTQHAEWKAQKCKELGIHVHYDDCRYIIERILEEGITALHVR